LLTNYRKDIIAMILFTIATLVIHFYFFASDSSFSARNADASKQFLFFKYLIHHSFSNGQFFWSWEYGLGGDLWGAFNYYYSASPFMLIYFLFHIANLHDILTIGFFVSLIQTFALFLFTYLLMRFNKGSHYSSMIGSLINGSSVFLAIYLLRVDYMASAFVWLPMLILSYERMLAKKKWGFFVFSVFIVVVSNFYFAFITSIFLLMYAFVKYLLIYKTYSFKSFFIHYARLSFMYFIGFGLAAFGFLPAVYAFLHADRFYKDHHLSLFFSIKSYRAAFYQLFYPPENIAMMNVGFPSIVIIVLLIGLFASRTKETKIRSGFAFFMLLLYLCPLTYSFFNGFSDLQPRWIYLMIFSVSLAIPPVLDELYKTSSNKRITWIFINFIILILLSAILKNELNGSYLRKVDVFALFIFITMAASLWISLIKRWRVFGKALLAVSLIVQIAFYDFQFYQMNLGPASEQKKLNDAYFNGSGFDSIKEKQIADWIKEKDRSFYRMIWMVNLEYNTPMYYGYNGFSAYQSLLPENTHQFIKTTYNINQIDSPSMYRDLDNRLYLETGLGNKYYVLPLNSTLIPYGYKKIKNFDQYALYENQFPLPLGFMYHKTLKLSKFNSLSPSEKDQLFLNAAVVEDNTHFNLATFNKNKLDTKTLFKGTKGIKFNQVTRNGEKWRVKNKNSKISIPVSIPDEPGEILVQMKLKTQNGKSFTIYSNGKGIAKKADGDKYAYPKDTFLFNIRRLNTNQNSIEIKLAPRHYIVEDFKITFTSYKPYEHLIKKLQTEQLKNIKVNGNHVEGEIKANKKGIIFLSIPYSKGWSVKIDDKYAEPHQINDTFTGVYVEKGTHKVEMHYTTPWFKTGMIISFFSLITLLSLWILYRKKKHL
jgi:uncharacterized membrane protein YfhO